MTVKRTVCFRYRETDRLLMLTAGFFTVTLQVYFFPWALAVILAEPTCLAVTFPLLTLATEESLEVHLTVCLQPDNFSFLVCFKSKVTFFAFSLGASTVTLHFFDPAFAFAVINALPFFFAVTFPFPETDATDFLEELQVTGPAPLLTFNLYVCPFTRMTDVLLIFIGLGAGAGSGAGSF